MSTLFKFAQAEHEHPSRDWTGWCLVFVRSCFGVAALYGSASSAWSNAKYHHPTTDAASIPRGVPVFWTGGSHGFGHIALSRGDGTCWTTDFVRPGQVDVARIDAIGPRWGMPLAGWTEDVNGVRVYEAKVEPKPQTPAPQEVKVSYGRNADAVLTDARKMHHANKAGTRRRKIARQIIDLIKSLRSHNVPRAKR